MYPIILANSSYSLCSVDCVSFSLADVMVDTQHLLKEFIYERVELIKSASLGVGSYGAVYKAKCDELPCAAKIIHPTLFETNDPGAQRIVDRFDQECEVLSGIRHPNVVQYLGVSRDPHSGMPVLLMELLDGNLTQFLEQSQEPLAYHTQVNICYDVVLALAYLHTNRIVHRDLSSNNVLLIAGSRAKVTDFGMAKVFDVNRRITPVTLCPGTMVYMAPEALRDQPVYTEKLDCFSCGVLGIQIMTQQFPNPGNRVTVLEDSRFPTGTIEIPVPEVERRRSHIDLIDPAHPLLPTALDCLKDRDRERPSAQELCHRLAALKEAPQYGESVRQTHGRKSLHTDETTDGNGREKQTGKPQDQVQNLQKELEIRRHELQAKDQQIEAKQQELIQHYQENQSLRQQLATKDDDLQQILEARAEEKQQLTYQLQQMEAAMAARDEEKQQLSCQLEGARQQLQEKTTLMETQAYEIQEIRKAIEELLTQYQLQVSEQPALAQLRELKQSAREKSREIQTKDREIQELRSQLRDVQHKLRILQQSGKPLNRPRHSSSPVVVGCETRERDARNGLTLHWRNCTDAPCEMYRGVSTVNYTRAYFSPGGSNVVYQFDSTDDSWLPFPKCPTYHFSLAVVYGNLTAIGGEHSLISPRDQLSNALYSLTSVGTTGDRKRERKWEEQLPRMPTKRSQTAAVVSEGKSLVVAGGLGKDRELDVVEVMDIDTRQWFTANSLPHPLCNASGAVCNNQLYFLGGRDRSGSPSKSVFTCQMPALLQTCRTKALGRLKRSWSTTSEDLWHRVSDTPSFCSTTAVLLNKLLAVGGQELDENGKRNDIHSYNQLTDSWESVNAIGNPRSHCLTAVLPGNKLMVVGGFRPGGKCTSTCAIDILVAELRESTQ